jgi:TrbC/VIRB2 pilin
MCYIFAASVAGNCGGMIQRKMPLAIEETTNINAMKLRKLTPQVRSRLRSLLMVAAILLLNTLSAFAQGAGGFNSTDLKTGISNSLAVIMMFGFVLGIAAVIYGGFAIRRGDVDQGKMSIIGGAIIAAAPAVVFAFYKIFGIDSNSSVGVGNF